jgi:hypothetical protein
MRGGDPPPSRGAGAGADAGGDRRGSKSHLLSSSSSAAAAAVAHPHPSAGTGTGAVHGGGGGGSVSGSSLASSKAGNSSLGASMVIYLDFRNNSIDFGLWCDNDFELFGRVIDYFVCYFESDIVLFKCCFIFVGFTNIVD